MDKAIENNRHYLGYEYLALILFTLAITSLAIYEGINFNQALAIAFTLAVLTLWLFDKFAGTLGAIIFFITKSFWVRIAFAIDSRISDSPGPDLLGITPALLISGLILIQLIFEYSKGSKLCADKAHGLLFAFCAISFLSIFNPASSPLIGLAGFERNIMPNMAILFLTATLAQSRENIAKLLKAFLVLGVISTIYAIGQYFSGLYPWETDWFRQLAFNDGLSGRLTIGLRGIEFRIFSIYYGYMDYFFSTVLIYALVESHKDIFIGAWRKLRVLFILSWFAILILSLERMPIVMTLMVSMAIYYFNSGQTRRRRIIWITVGAVVSVYATLIIAGPFLQATGADKLIRMAEMANPLDAESINDRIMNKWQPALEIIKSNPLGVGIGYGSQTKANDISKSDLFIQPHNELIQKTLETGILGGLLYLLLLLYLLRDFIALGKSDSVGRKFGLALAVVSLSFFLCGLVNLPFSGASGILFWALAGVALGQKKKIQLIPSKPFEQKTDNSDGQMLQIETGSL
jgi:O-antigen ligase